MQINKHLLSSKVPQRQHQLWVARRGLTKSSTNARISASENVARFDTERADPASVRAAAAALDGGLAAAVKHVSGSAPTVYHNDHSRPESPKIRHLGEEIARVVRARVVNPKWIDGVMRHGYKGAFEMAATVDYLFAFAATTNAVRDHQFDAVYDAYIEQHDVLEFLRTHNPAALAELSARLREALERGLWRPRSNSARTRLDALSANPHVTG